MTPYGHHWRTRTRPRMLARAGHECEQCAVPDHRIVWRVAGRWWIPDLRQWFSQDSLLPWHWPKGQQRQVAIRLEVCHLDRDPTNQAENNLRTLCQWCHRNYDRPVSVPKARDTRAGQKDERRPLLALAQQSLPGLAQEESRVEAP